MEEAGVTWVMLGWGEGWGGWGENGGGVGGGYWVIGREGVGLEEERGDGSRGETG